MSDVTSDERRFRFHAILEALMGSSHVYFQPPPSLKMQYPAIVYRLATVDTIYSNNIPYGFFIPYEVILIDKNPDSAFRSKLLKLPMARHNRSYVRENLHHDVFTIFY